MGRIAAVAALAAGVGYLAEAGHLRCGVWVLKSGSSLPGWVALVYLFAFLAFGAVLEHLERRSERRLHVTTVALPLESLAFAVIVFSPALAFRHELSFAILLAAYVVLRLRYIRARGDVLIAVLAASANFALELALIAAGLYRYPVAAWLPVPLWLAPFWAGIGLSLRRAFAFAGTPKEQGP